MPSSIRRFVATAVFSVAASVSTSWAQAASTIHFHVIEQPLADALRELGSQANANVMFTELLVEGKQAPAVEMNATLDQVLARILEDTGLTHRFLNDYTVVLSTVGGRNSVAKSYKVSAPDMEAAELDERPSDRQHNPARETQAMPGESTRGEGDQTTSNNDFTEVVVTAQRREERLIDVPISIIALNGEELQSRRVNSLDDLASVVPGLAISSAGGSGRAIELRGVSNLSGSASLIGLYFDEADVTLGATSGGGVQLNPSAYDLERVEVLRGPQGTLYGEGSAGGTIRFITRKPDLSRFAFGSDVAAQFTEEGAPGGNINAFVNVPLIENKLGLRIVGTFDDVGGWINQPLASEKDINEQEVKHMRVKGLWQPNSQFMVSAMAVINRTDRSVDVSDEDQSGNFTQVFNLTTTPRLRSDSDLYNITLTYDSAVARVLSTSTYVSVDNPIWNQSNSYQLTPPGTPPYEYYAPTQKINDHLYTQELRLTSLGTGPWQWTSGVFYRHYRDSFENPLNYFDLSGPPGTPLPAPYSLAFESLSKSGAVFGDVSYKLGNRLTLGTGVRYFHDDREYSDHIAVTTQTDKFHSVDPRFHAQYKLTENMNVYTSAAKGFRSGGFNSLGQPSYDPESVWTYEFGTKMSLLDGHLRADTAVFWSNYTDYQTLAITAVDPNPLTANVGAARIKGVEWNLSWRPSDQWRLNFSGDYLHSKFVRINGTSTAYEVGDPIDLVPKYQSTISGEHNFTFAERQGFVRLDYSQQGPKTYRNRGVGPWFNYESDVIRLLDFHTSLSWSDTLRLGIFAQNLLDEDGFVNPFANTLGGVRPRPRTFGVSFSVSFDGSQQK